MRKLKDKEDNPEIIYIANGRKRIFLSLHGEILEEYRETNKSGYSSGERGGQGRWGVEAGVSLPKE